MQSSGEIILHRTELKFYVDKLALAAILVEAETIGHFDSRGDGNISMDEIVDRIGVDVDGMVTLEQFQDACLSGSMGPTADNTGAYDQDWRIGKPTTNPKSRVQETPVVIELGQVGARGVPPPDPTSVYEVTLNTTNEQLGFRIKKWTENNLGGAYLSSLVPGGQAMRVGAMKTGQLIVEINGVDIRSANMVCIYISTRWWCFAAEVGVDVFKSRVAKLTMCCTRPCSPHMYSARNPGRRVCFRC